MLIAVAACVSESSPVKPLKSITGIVVPRPNATSAFDIASSSFPELVRSQLSNRVFNDDSHRRLSNNLRRVRLELRSGWRKTKGCENKRSDWPRLSRIKKPAPSPPPEYSSHRGRAIRKLIAKSNNQQTSQCMLDSVLSLH